MKTIQRIALFTFLSILLTSCFGDKGTIVGQELGDTDFVNTKFSGNKVAFSALSKNLCEYIHIDQIKKLYPDASKVLVDDGKTFQSKNCRFLVYVGEGEFNYLSGSIFALKDNFLEGQDWKEAWEFKKKMSKSSEYIGGLGKAAVWIGKKRELSIKLEGYSITITVPGAPFNKEEIAKKRDYKDIAIKIANNSGLF
ncbi:hypothetical protein U8527_06085 [Kordia algicida OT-1]|uniref:Lipoprotein n=1 Tax=Kordia algicida OT-1 TaxID=391587 RepID=A9E181_9FLAO|nr:hypothetical protein [Kordia algicida]EDP95594.1 hypothetical protein KAOT1_22121 [Kordia algicida OT-1]